MSKPKVIIAASLDFNDYNLLKEKCDYYLQRLLTPEERSIEIITQSKNSLEGFSSPSTELIHEYIAECEHQLTVFHGSKNSTYDQFISDLVDYADCAIIFSDGVDQEIKGMIDACKNRSLKYRVVNYIPTIAD